MNDAGDGIASVASLSAEWQVLSASVANAPMWDGAEAEAGVGEEGRGLMLRIEGVGVADGEDGGAGSGSGGKAALGEEELQGLLEGFDRQMAVLRTVVAAGEGWTRGEEKEDVGNEG